MTKAQIIERLKAAGVTGWDKKNLAELEAMAADAGVSLAEDTETPEVLPAESSKPTPSFAEATDGGDASAPSDAPRFITPSMACSRSYFGADPTSES